MPPRKPRTVKHKITFAGPRRAYWKILRDGLNQRELFDLSLFKRRPASGDLLEIACGCSHCGSRAAFLAKITYVENRADLGRMVSVAWEPVGRPRQGRGLE